MAEATKKNLLEEHMKYFKNLISIFIISLVAAISAGQKPVVAAENDWREQYAYSMGISALNFLYPYLRGAMVRWNWSVQETQHPYRYP